MIAKRQVWNYPEKVKVWVGKYRNSHNLLHWHSDCEMLYVEKGSIDVFCDKKMHRLIKGDLLYVDSGQVHYMQAKEADTVLIVIIFDYDILRPYVGDLRLMTPKLSGSYPIPEIYAEIRDILLKKPPFFAGETAGKIISLMSSIYRGEALTPRVCTDKTGENFIALLDEIAEHCENFGFEDAVAFMGMSDAYFSHYFKKAAGISFSQYLNYVRTERAVELLTRGADKTMTEIAQICGFGTIRNFNRIFKSLTGYAPSTLPRDFEFGDRFAYPSDSAFNPTLHDCELIESGE